ncbi:MAG: hypothetical protein A3C13_03750 [Candidatus Lloydbacteria bacterium RIFCSPHIGHO2_02_FULL_50_11]|nr:MAG: hypothetical protein A3C13_03750 [Candidatus Lloydbacteria bacterium RIFCSPHIGHO2_02_FULL_50_11]
MFLGKLPFHSAFFDRALVFILLAVAFLLPIFFVPSQLIAPEFGKMIFLEVFVLLAIFLWTIARLRDGHVDVPKSLLLLVSALLVVQFIAAAFMSPAPLVSFIGSGYDLGTVSSFVLLFLLMFLGSMVFTNRDRVLMLFVSFVSSGVLVMIYHLLRQFFGPDFLDFGIFTSAVSSPVGRWNDFASLLGGVLLLVLSTLYFFPQNNAFRVPAFLAFLVGLFFLLAINFSVLWLILLVMTALLVALSVYEGEREHRRVHHEAHESGGSHHHRPFHRRFLGHLPVVTTVLFLVALVYGTGLASVNLGKDNTTIAGVVAKSLGATPYSEVVLTPKFTYDIVKNTLESSPLFGTGPNRFSSAYLQYKMTAVNRTPFWDSTFDFGLGRVPTYFGTTGLVGMVLWLFFVVFLFVKGRKVFALFAKDRMAAYIGFSLFLLSLYFWSLASFYLPNTTIFASAFLFTGALIAFLAGEGVIGRYHLAFGGRSRLSVVLTPVAIALLVGVIAAGVLLYRQTSSLVAFNEAQVAAAANNIPDAEKALIRALNFAERDVYYRALSSLALAKLQGLSQQQLSQEQFAVQAKQLIDESRVNAEKAIKLDPTNFENHLQYGSVFDTLASLGVQNTTSFARENYEQALRLNPKSPRVLFMLAQVEFVSGDRAKAKEYLRQALLERPNLPEALSSFVQLELQDNNPTAAITAVQAGILVEPTNYLFHFTLGYLYYLQNNLTDAIPQFEVAVALNPSYADAKYFLGLSYAATNRIGDAIQQFEGVQLLNPNNKEVETIIQNLKAGRLPFNGVAPASIQPTSAPQGLNQKKSQ